MVLGVLPGGDLLILDVLRRRLDVGNIVPALAQLCRRWQPSFVGMESVAFQRLLVLEAAKHPSLPPVHELKPAGKGKLARAVGAIVKAERGEIHLPERAGWLEDFETELGAFVGVNDPADDQVDCLAYAVGASLLYVETTDDCEPVLGASGLSELPYAGAPDW